MKAVLVAVATLPLGLAALLGGLVIAVPMVSDEQIQLYVSVAQSMEAEVPWQTLVAVDAVRYRQDFSKVNRRSVQETANLLVACDQQVTDHGYSWVMESVGESMASQIIVAVPSTIAWTIHQETGEIVAVLVDSRDQPVSGDQLQPGFYALVLTAITVPAPYRAEIKVTAEERICYGRPLEDVLDDLGFSDDDRYLVAALLDAFTGQTDRPTAALQVIRAPESLTPDLGEPGWKVSFPTPGRVSRPPPSGVPQGSSEP